MNEDEMQTKFNLSPELENLHNFIPQKYFVLFVMKVTNVIRLDAVTVAVLLPVLNPYIES